jgi:glucokinase
VTATTIGVDVGGTKIAAGVVGEDGNIVARHQLPSEAQDPRGTVNAILKVVTELRAVAPAAAAVGLGAAALIDFSRGLILGAPDLAWRNLAIVDLLRDRVGLPVVLDNDANVAALGEATYGAGRGGGDQIMVTVGTGIGGGIIIDGRIYRGSRGAGAELGHMVVDPHGPVCGCGNHGCLEAHASGTAMGRMARERIREGDGSGVLDLAGNVDSITGAIVGHAALHGDAFALSIVREAGWWLGVGLASFVNIFDPERIGVGGGVTQGIGEILLEPARASMRNYVLLPELRPEVPVVAAALGNDAGLVGAAVLARSAIAA